MSYPQKLRMITLAPFVQGSAADLVQLGHRLNREALAQAGADPAAGGVARFIASLLFFAAILVELAESAAPGRMNP